MRRDFLIAVAKGPEAQGLVLEFRRFISERAGMHRASGAGGGRRSAAIIGQCASIRASNGP